MKILVTGAGGYLGQGIVKALLDEGHEVIAADRETGRVDERALRLSGDLFEPSAPFEAFGRPETLLHLAWRDGFIHYSDAHIADLPKHYGLIQRMAEGGVRQIAVMGSMHEIGFHDGSIDEQTPCRPTTPYGISKNALRQLTEMVCKQKNIVFQWLRGFYIVGNSGAGSSVFSKIAAAAEAGQKEFPFTLGQNQYDFIDYNDFCRQVAAAVGQRAEQGIINICSGRPEKLADRAERFIRENHYDIQLRYGAFPDRPYDSKAVWGNSERIEKIMRAREMAR